MNTVNISPELLGKVGEAFAVSLDALQRRLQPMLPAAQAEADTVRTAVDRLQHLAIQLQELARVLAGAGRPVPETIDLREAFGQACAGWQAAAKRRGVKLVAPPPRGEAFAVRIVAGVLDQLIELLLDHATRLGEQVHCALERHGEAARPMLVVRVQREGARAADGIDEVHWLLFDVLARAAGLAPHRVAAGDTVTLMLDVGEGVAPASHPTPATGLPRTTIGAARQVLLLEPLERPRVLAHDLLRKAGLRVDATATLEQARAALRERMPDLLVTGLAADQGECAALIEELRAVQPRLRVVELVDDEVAFALSLPGSGRAARVGRHDLARTLVAAVTQELDAAYAGLA
jgi:CheY-like chemotaxis protein